MALDFEAFSKEVNEMKGIQPEQPAPAEDNTPPAAPQEKGILDTPLTETIGNFINNTEADALHGEQLQASVKAAIEDQDTTTFNPDAVDDNPGVDPEIQKENERGAFAPFKDLIEEKADDKDAFFSDQATAIRASSVFRNLQTNDEKAAAAHKIGRDLGIPPQLLLDDENLFKEARYLYDEYEKEKHLAGGKPYTLKNFYDSHPSIRGLADMDEEQIALALRDIDSVDRVHGIINSFTTMYDQGTKKLEHDKLWYKVYDGSATDDQKKQAEQMYQQLNNPLNMKSMPIFMENPLEYAVAGFGQSLPQMLEDIGGSVVGGVMGASLAGAAALFATATTAGTMTVPSMSAAAAFGWTWGQRIGGTGTLAQLEIGSAYAEKKHITDDKGKPLYTDEELQVPVAVEGVVNAIIEDWSNKTVAGMILPKTAIEKQALKETTAVIFEQAEASASLSAAWNKFARDRAGDFIKGTVAESGEEFAQRGTSDLANNLLVFNTGKGEYVSTYDMARNATGAFIESLPTSALFAGSSTAGGTVTGIGGISRQMMAASNIGQYAEKSQQTILGMNMLASLQAAVQSSKLKDLAPDVQRKIINQQAAGTGFSMVYIDTKSALEKENGMNNLQKVADAAGYDQETLQTAIEQGNLSVPLEVYAQSEADPDLLSSVSFSAEAPSIEEMKRDIKESFSRQQEIMKDTIEKQKKLMDQITSEYFPNDKEGSDMAAAAIFENAENPAQGLKTIEKRILDDRFSILQPALDILTQRISSNENVEGDWYDKFQKTFKRQPSEKELIDMATALMTGDENAPQVPGWSVDPEISTDVRDKLAAINRKLAIVDRTKEKISSLTKAEIKLTEGMTPEAYSVYKTLWDKLSHGPGTSSRAARMNAILLARHADIYARVITEKTGRKYTAKDYYQERLAVAFEGEQANTASADQTFNQEVASQSEEIRKQYEGTDQWMKAPNGEDTNLTEAQWLAVRTAAFKNWFGDWENDPDNASKVVDENGEPLVMYHGTRAIFDTFDTSEEGENRKSYESAWNAEYPEGTMFFTSSEYQAKYYGSIIMPVFLNLRYPEIREVETGENMVKPFDDEGLAFEGEAIVKNTKGEMVASTMYANSIKSATGNNGNYSTTDDNIYHQIIGQQGAGDLDKAQEVTTRLDNLNVARQMETSGKDAKTIRLATGWERGADGLWRYEIKEPKFTKEFYNLDHTTRRGMKIVDALKGGMNNELLQAYPELAKWRVRFTVQGRKDDIAGWEDFEKKQIVLSEFMYAKDNREDHFLFKAENYDHSLEGVFMHEIQHAIQDIEGFAKGTDVRENENEYHRNAGETEARNVTRRMDMTWEQRQQTLLAETEDVAREDQIFLRDNSSKKYPSSKIDWANPLSIPKPKVWAYKTSSDAKDYTKQEIDEINQYHKTILEAESHLPLKTQMRRLTKRIQSVLKVLESPNWKESNLSKFYYLVTRTFAFRNIYGDWLSYANAIQVKEMAPVSVHDDGENGSILLDKCVEDSKKKPFENNHDGRKAEFPRTTIGKISGHSGIEIARIAGSLKKLYENSVFICSSQECLRYGHTYHKETFAYHDYVNKFNFEGSDDVYYVRFTLRENGKKGDGTGYTIMHSLALSDIKIYKKNKGTIPLTPVSGIDRVPSGNAPFVDKIIQNFFEDVNNIKLKIELDENNEPIITDDIAEKINAMMTDMSDPTDEFPPKTIERVFQTVADDSLVSYHNISEEKLEKALALGGLPLPSIAIMGKDSTHENFGEITLVGTRDMVDPEKGTDVYARDAYTTRIPTAEYKGISEKAAAEIISNLEGLKRIPGGEAVYNNLKHYATYYPDEIDSIVNNKNELFYYYLTEIKGITPDKHMVKTNPSIERVIYAGYKENLENDTPAGREKLAKLESLRYKKQIKEKEESLKEAQGKIKAAEQGTNHPGPIVYKKVERLPGIIRDLKDAMARDIQEVDGKQRLSDEAYNKLKEAFDTWKNENETSSTIDWNETMYQAKQQYKDIRQKEFKKWADTLIAKLKGEPMIKLGRKMVPYTLENITQKMLSSSGPGQEYSSFSPSKVAAVGAKKFKSIAEIKKNSNKLVDEQTVKDVITQVEEKLDDAYNAVEGKHKFLTHWGDVSEAFYEGVANAIKGGKHATRKSITSAFKKLEFDTSKFTDKDFEIIIDAANTTVDAAAFYFEAKPQRSVSISEFAGAVVPKDADEKLVQRLKDAGLQVETYDADIEGDRQRATQLIQQQQDVLFQNAKNPLGSTSLLANGQRLVQLFSSADESTFLHEMGHVFLMDLEDLAKIDDVSAAELAKVKEWAAWKKGDKKFYRDTPWYKEFADLEKNILAAEEAGDMETADRLKKTWMHERFARGFEMYLKDGKAPAAGLRAVFRKFAAFLRQVYTAFTSDGARPSAEVEAIMARMIATDEEVEAMALDNQFKDIEKAGGEKLLTETERETYERWLSEAKEEAKEKLYKIVMADLQKKKEAEYRQAMKEEEAKITTRMEQEPIYLARAIIAKLGGDVEKAMPIILDHCFPDRQAYEAADKAAPALADAVKQELENWQRQQEEQNRSQISEDDVRTALETATYTRKAKALETAAMSRKLDTKRKITDKVEAAIQRAKDAIEALPDDTDLVVDKYTKRVKQTIKRINEIRFATKWNNNDFQKLDQILKSSTKEEMAQLLEDFTRNMKQQKLNISDVEKANEGRLKLYAEMAAKAAKEQSIYNATNSGNHRSNQRKAERRVLQMIKAGRFDMALQQSQQAALSAAMAQAAERTKEEVDRLISHINQQLNARTVKLPAKERYWHKHIAFLLGIGMNDAQIPVLKEGQQLGSLQDLIAGYKDRLDLSEDYDANEVIEFITSTAAQQSYVALTLDQLKQAAQLLDIIYKCGKDAFELKTVKGKTIESVVDEILDDEVALAKKMGIEKRRIQDNIGGLGYNEWLAKIPTVGECLAKAGQNYLTIGLKPEKLIELLGKTAYQYIFGTFDTAANKEADMMAQAVKDIQNILKDYSKKERRTWKKRAYKLDMPDGETVELSKENILAMALNMGTELNRQRLYGGLLGEKYNGPENIAKINKLIFDTMTKKDWKLVQGIWDYLHTYWADTVRVEQELNGMQLQPQEPMAFSVFANGEKIDLQGGYYPIAYNPDKNNRTSVQAQDDVAKQMGGSAKVLGTGRSHTKARVEADVFRELQLTLDIIPKHLNQVIHNITTRIAARDVYRLLNHQELSRHISDQLGAPALNMLRKWALDVWTQLPEKDMAANVLEQAVGALRRNSTFAIMAYRIWPVIENTSNYAVVADKLGHAKALSAIADFFGNFKEYKLLLEKSVMMRNRINNMDRDIRSQPGLFEVDHPAVEMLKEHGYDLMTYSDLMFSAPLWCRAYKDVFHLTLKEVNDANENNKRTVQEAQNKLDMLRGQHLDADNDIREWYKEEKNRKNAGQVGWQPGTSRFAVMGHQEFTEQLEDLKNRKDELGAEIWAAEADFSRATELNILDEAGVVKEAERQAAAKADAVVRDAFGSGRTVDLPAVQRSYSELVKAMTSFYSFFNTVFNSLYFSYIESRYGRQPGKDAGAWAHIKQWAPLARAVMHRVILLSFIGSVLKMATKTDGDDDRDKYRKVTVDGQEVKEEIPWLQRFLKVFAKNTLGTATGSLYGVRDLANIAMNLAFDGTDYGRGLNIVSTPLRSIEEGMRTVKLIAAKSKKDLEIAEKEAKDIARYKKMTSKQRKKWLEEQKYKKPIKRITWEEVFRHGANALTGLTAAKTGVSSTIVDSVTGTMQYLLDTDNRYDATWRNIIWSAIFDKKPVENQPPEKPEKKKPQKRRRQ